MTNNITVIGKQTIKKRVKQGIVLCLSTFVLGAGIGSVNYYAKSREQSKKEKAYEMNMQEVNDFVTCEQYSSAKKLLDRFEWKEILKQEDIQKLRTRIEENEYQDRKKKISKAIEEEDFSLATILLDESEKALNAVDVQSLRLDMNRNKSVSRLKKLIKKYDLKNARTLLQELEASGIYPAWQIRELEARIEGITPKRFAENIKEAKGNDLVKLCKEYLSIYPKEKETSEVVERLLMQKFKDLAQKLKEKELVPKVINSIQELNDDIKTYKQVRTDIPKFVGVEDFRQRIEDYIKQKEEEKYECGSKAITVGAKVKVIENFFGRWGDYARARAAILPVGTEGVVLKPWEVGGDVLVEFDKNREYNWPHERYSFTDEWEARGHKGIARFDPKELEIVKDPVSPIDIQKLRLESEKIIKSLKE